MSKDKDNLGNRMKTYERVSQSHLMRRTPVILRLDGKTFHTFTKGFDKPFDKRISESMMITALTLCEEIQGVKLAYIQSDEISLLLTDYETFETQAWYDNNVQKLVSVSASIATAAFNDKLDLERGRYGEENNSKPGYHKVAHFDSRCFNLTKEEVANYFWWRQQDAIRNSVAAVAHANFSQKELQNKNREDMKKMLLEKGIDFDRDIPTKYQRGFCFYYDERNSTWALDEEIPFFKNEREYIERFVYGPED